MYTQSISNARYCIRKDKDNKNNCKIVISSKSNEIGNS